MTEQTYPAGTKWYIGYDENGRGEVFGADRSSDATPEASGYESVNGPYKSLEDAKDELGDER